MSVAALAFLVIDPTIAAHLPVVLTDLPVALLEATSVRLAFSAFKWNRTPTLMEPEWALSEPALATTMSEWRS